MLKILNLIVCVWSINLLIAQETIYFQMEHVCSRSKQSQQSILKQKNPYQSPLLFHYDVKFYFLDLAVENNTVDIAGNVTIHAKVSHLQLDTIAFELLDELIVDSVLVNGFPNSFFRNNDEVFIPLTYPFHQEEDFISQIFYHGTPPTGGSFRGISTKYDTIWNKNVTWTLSEPFNARQWWPTKQVLTDKADSVWVYITTSAQNKAGSNGLLTDMVNLPNNKIRFEWKSKYPIAYYLISFAVAEYQEYNIYAKPSDLMGDSILIQNYIYDSPGCLSHFKNGIDNSANFLELFSDLYSGYPFRDEKYGHCLAGLSGGMEHQTMTTIGRFDFSLVAHELGHMWFGDNVTCSNWSDIWINEGFATYSDYLATEKIAGEPWPTIMLNNVHNYVLSEPGGSVFVPEEDVTYENVSRIFNSRLTYWKGAMLLHMIRFELQDDELFFTVLKNFQQSFANSLASTPDFINTLNVTTGLDFNGFFEQWYYGEGYPIYSITYKQTGTELEIEAIQTTSMPDITTFYKMKMPYKLFFSDGTDSTVILHQQSNNMNFTLPLTKSVDSIQVDPDKWTLKKVESINNISENSAAYYLSLSPNPVDDILNIQSKGGVINQIIIRNLYGNKIKEIQTMQPISFINVSELNPGVYFITINLNDSYFTLKFIKL